jgi:UDPglucose 6-dehydrogenase
MKLAVIGTGYVGLVAGVCFAESGNDVICVDVVESKVERLRNGEVTIYEPGLDQLFGRNLREGRLDFTTDLQAAVSVADIIFLALPTPPGEDGSADLSYVLGAAEDIGRILTSYKVIVTKSTVPVGTADAVREKIALYATSEFDVVSNPEFLREGMAIADFMRPDRVVIGTDSPRAERMMRELYHPFLLSGNPIMVMDPRSSELTKYACNAMLALRISFMNDIATLCEQCGANVDHIRLGMGLDTRIGKRFLFPGIGYGGSCFPKDVQALTETGRRFGATQQLLEVTHEINERQKRSMLTRLQDHFGDLKGKKFAIWGLAFKPDTDDVREAPSIILIRDLLEQGAEVSAYDPEAIESTRRVLGDSIVYTSRHYDACEGADALIVLTEWNKFREPDFDYLKDLLNEPIIFDGRNIYEIETMRNRGFTYYSIGRPAVLHTGVGAAS